MEYIKTSDKNVMDTYGRFQIVIEKGKGGRLTDINGKEYIDFTSGIGVSSLGYGDKKLTKAISAQAKKLCHISNLYYSLPYTNLSEKIIAATGAKKVFFANSGAETNEGAIKLARKYSFDKYGAGRANIITLTNSFHGRTVTTLAATGQDELHQFFDPFTPGFIHCQSEDIKELKSKIDSTVCAVMIEIIQGEGGVVPLSKKYLKSVEEICKAGDILLIVDEVQTGVGRTGSFLAVQGAGITPDIVTLAKGLGGGLPIGAFLAYEKCENTLGKAQHGSTFGGNPVACAAACEVIDRVDTKRFLSVVKRKGKYIKNKLENNPKIKNVRGEGLMIGFDIECDNKELINKLNMAGLLCLSAKKAVRLLPPLTISYKDIDAGLKILEENL